MLDVHRETELPETLPGAPVRPVEVFKHMKNTMEEIAAVLLPDAEAHELERQLELHQYTPNAVAEQMAHILAYKLKGHIKMWDPDYSAERPPVEEMTRQILKRYRELLGETRTMQAQENLPAAALEDETVMVPDMSDNEEAAGWDLSIEQLQHAQEAVAV